MNKLFNIFGNPVSHSISPLIHNYTIKSLDIDACYTRIKLNDGAKIREKFFDLNITGANITVPFKEDAYRTCDEICGIAKDIKAVNTIIKKKGKLFGYNTDAPGFYETIKDIKDIKKILIIGAGGTARAISIYLRKKSYNITILNRSKHRLKYFEKEGFVTYSWDNFNKYDFDMIINTTSAGLKDEIFPIDEKILLKIFANSKYAIDIIYNKQTPFLKLAKKNNLSVKDGKDMLIFQAILAFEIFFDFKYKKEDIEKYMFEAISIV